jgi:hypothetical protein
MGLTGSGGSRAARASPRVRADVSTRWSGSVHAPPARGPRRAGVTPSRLHRGEAWPTRARGSRPPGPRALPGDTPCLHLLGGIVMWGLG